MTFAVICFLMLVVFMVILCGIVAFLPEETEEERERALAIEEEKRRLREETRRRIAEQKQIREEMRKLRAKERRYKAEERRGPKG